MFGSILIYCCRRFLKKAAFLTHVSLLFIKVSEYRIRAQSFRIDYWAQNEYLFRLITQDKKPGFGLMLWAIRFARYLLPQAIVCIHVHHFNYFYISEMVNHCLLLKGIRQVDIYRFSDGKEQSLWRGYVKLVDNLNHYLEPCRIEISLQNGEDILIARMLNAIDQKIPVKEGHPASFNEKVRILEEAKKFSPSRAGRYLSLYAEEVMLGPEIVVMDIYHQCNTDCLHCWMHSPTAKKLLSKGFLSQQMNFNAMKGIVDDCVVLGVDAITLLGDGEPVLNPDFLKILWYIKNKNCDTNVMTFSNGLAVTPKMSHELINAGLNEIWFSVPAATGETYRKVCPSKTETDFRKVKRNIAHLCRLKRSLRGIYKAWDVIRWKKTIPAGGRGSYFSPYCIIVFVLHRENYHEIIHMAKMAVELGVDEMRFQLIHLDKDNKALQLDQEQVDFLNAKLFDVKSIAEKGKVALSSALKFQLSHMSVSTGDWARGYYLEHGCPIGFFFSIIKANGDVGLCCGLKVIDNLRDKTFYDIWMSPGYQRARVCAKHLAENRDMPFRKTDYHKNEKRGDLLYSERCEYCDNHDLNNEYINALMQNGLYDRFMKT